MLGWSSPDNRDLTGYTPMDWGLALGCALAIHNKPPWGALLLGPGLADLM